MFKNEINYDNADSSSLELTPKQVIVELENWWKNKIDDFEVNEENKFEFDVLIKTDDLKKVLYIEKTLKEILNENDLNIKKLVKNLLFIIFLTFNIERLNLALETQNLKLKKVILNLFVIDDD